MDSNSTPTTDSTPTSNATPSCDSTHDSSPKNSRGKTDPAWGHCSNISSGSGKTKIACLYCQRIFSGGGIHRFKQHLAGVKGEVEGCKKVAPDIRYQMQKSIESHAKKKRKSQDVFEEQNLYGPELRAYEEKMYMQNDELEEIAQSAMLPPKSREKQSSTSAESKKGIKFMGIGNYFMPRITPGAQLTIKSVLQSKEAIERCDIAISKWMIDASIPFNAINSVYFQPMIDAVASMGAGYKGPNFHSFRGYLLAKNVEETKKCVDSYRATWKETGCTIMADGWTDQCRRTLINFLVYCPRGTVFLKSVNASKIADLLYKLFKEIMLFVGPENVVHMVTDNAANYVTAGRLLENEFPTLYWSPCAAHCLNLMLHDIGKLDEVCNIVNHASKITKYIYNHCYALYLMRKHTNGREILRPTPTRLATNFIALQSILAKNDALRAMVTSKEWTTSAYSKDKNGRKFVDLVLDSTFWKECAAIMKLKEPLVRVLRIVDADDRPAMGYLYEAIHRAREEMLKRFQGRKKKVDPYLKILDARWDRQLHKNLHATGYWLNPRNQYNTIEMAKNNQTTSGLLDVIEKYSHGNSVLRSKLTSEMKVFRTARGDFGRISAISDRDVMLPDEWWRCYGSDAPNLQKLAIRVLSQTCSASGCERNWSIFEHVHSKKRNRLEHQRLNDLVYVHYNLRLQQRNHFKGRNYDPIDFEDFEENGDWVLEEEPTSLSIDELEVFRQQLASCNVNTQDNDDLNLDDVLNDDDEDINPLEDENENFVNMCTDHILGNEPSSWNNASELDSTMSHWPSIDMD
ncbi:hypothetical protein REPUB_Repub01dG0139600 [Reevesia pubescens]